MTELWIARHVLPAAYSVLPAAAQSDRATAMLLAIGWQESRFEHRRQLGGPARGWWQFENDTVRLTLAHQVSGPLMHQALRALAYPGQPIAPMFVHHAIEHNDVLAAVTARALLRTHPEMLPTRDDVGLGWTQYMAVWRPGKPKPATWEEAWRRAWAAIDSTKG